MKIGILTLHYAHNYGAVLQAYALCTYLRNEGHDARIVDYRLPFIYEQYLPLDFRYFYHQFLNENNRLVSFLKALNYYRTHRHRNVQWQRFHHFINKTLPRTTRIFKDEGANILDLDAIVCGSDQIWNERLTNGWQNIYFCEGTQLANHKIAYAASMGSCLISEEKKTTFARLIKNFNSISVREQGLADTLRSLGFCSKVVLDPVFLLEKNDWKKILGTKPLIKGGYVLTYSFSEPSNFFDEAIQFSKRNNLPLVCILFSREEHLPEDVVQVTDAGPLEFLNYFYNASFTITNSFHGTAFSVVMEKQFFCVPPSKGRERTDSLLYSLGLEARIQRENFSSEAAINYDSVRPRLQQLRMSAGNFLRDSLSNS